MPYKLKAKVWLWPGEAAWHFLILPKKDAAEIRKVYREVERGWSSLPLKVTIGKTTWKTSMFYDKGKSSYLLPLKKEVRKAENIKAGETLEFSFEIRD